MNLQKRIKCAATIYCGPDYFQAHKEEVIHKIHNLILKRKQRYYLQARALIMIRHAQMACGNCISRTRTKRIVNLVICSKKMKKRLRILKIKSLC